MAINEVLGKRGEIVRALYYLVFSFIARVFGVRAFWVRFKSFPRYADLILVQRYKITWPQLVNAEE